MSATLSPLPKSRYFDANGNPLAGGKLYSYQAGTTTPLATYTDSTGGTPNANPVILDANGEANVWLGASSYKLLLKDANDVTQWTVDNITVAALSLKTLNGIRFADQFAGATVTLQITAAANDLGGSGLVIIPSTMGAGAIPTLPAGVMAWDLRNSTGNGAINMQMQLLSSFQSQGLRVAIQNSPDAANGTAIYGDATSAGAGLNIIGVTGIASSASSAGVFGFNNGSGGTGGIGVQGDCANLPSAVGVLGTSADSGATALAPSVAVKGLAVSATIGIAIGGQFISNSHTALQANNNGAAASGQDTRAIDAVSGLQTSTTICIRNTDTGGKRWDLATSGSVDPLTAAVGTFYLWNQTDNLIPFIVAPATPSSTLVLGANGVKITRHYASSIPVFVDGDTSPSVSASNVFKTANTAPTTISAFDDGVAGQELTIIFADANTTLSGGTLKMSAGFTSTVDDTIKLIFDGTNWYELSRSVN